MRFVSAVWPLLALLSVIDPQAVCTNAHPIWRIGSFDQASIEFAKQLDYSDPAQDPVFVIGESEAAKDWPAYQPGSANGPAGYRLHPFSIIFDLHDPPSGRYTLKIGILAY